MLKTPRTLSSPKTPTFSHSSTKSVIIQIHSAHNVPKADPTGLSDPYCVVGYQKLSSKGIPKDKKYKTDICHENLNPCWKQTFLLQNIVDESDIKFSVFDWDNIFKFSSDDFLGEFHLKIKDIPMNEKKIWKVPLFDNTKAAGELVFVTYALDSKETTKMKEKEYKQKVQVTENEIQIPQMINKYHNRLEITIMKTSNFISEKEKRNIFAQVKVGKQMLETPVYKSKGNPQWNTQLTFQFKTSNKVTIALRDWKMLSSNEPLGSSSVTLTDIKDGIEIEKQLDISGINQNGKLHCKIKVTRFTNITETIPLESERECGEDEWCKHNIQFFESFIGKPKINDIISFQQEENAEKYDFETKKDDITNIISDEEFGFNYNYFEKPIIEGILTSQNKTAYYNTIQTSIGHILLVVGDAIDGLHKAVSMTKLGRVKLYINNMKSIDKEIMNLYGLKKEEVKMKELQTDIWNELKEFELNDRQPQYKFGLVYAQKNQTTEREFLANVETSKECEEFYNLIGTRIQLKGYTGYNGRLDVSNGRTGEYSITTKYRNNDIMFHVSTMLYHDEKDPQFIAKKRHIGNDVIVIVFKEVNEKGTDTIKLDSFMSHYNHIYFIVTPLIINNEKVYRVTVCCKKPVQAFLPRFPEEQYFKRDEQFVDWLLCKCINGERAALESAQFVKAPRVVNEGFLERVLKDVDKK